MPDLAHLHIRVSAEEVDSADSKLSKLANSGGRAERATSGLAKSFRSLAGPLLAAVSATAAISKITEITREFNALNAQLITATGSAENAAEAFMAIQQFASDTPYDLAQVTSSFTKLVNLGLTPSERALTSYGNTAAAMGKDMNQLIEAVADAATGEFERLKEFGIKSRSQGDQVSFTFRGVTTTVKKNASEIEGYLMALGENEFAGAMSQRMNTLDGALSNLGDEWNKLFLNISQMGTGELIEDTVRTAISALQELNALIASGELMANIDIFYKQWKYAFESISDGIEFVTEYLSISFNKWIGDSEKTSTSITESFAMVPRNIVDGFKIIAAEMNALMQRFDAFERMATAAVNPFDDYSVKEAMAWYQNRIAEIDADVAVFRINMTLSRQAAVTEIKQEMDAAQKLREEYEKTASSKVKGDRLAKFKTGGDGNQQSSEATKEFNRLVESLRTQEEAVLASYQKRRKIIIDNTQANSEERKKLLARLDREFSTDIMIGFGEEKVKTYDQQISDINNEYQVRREAILANTQMTKEQQTQLEIELERRKNEQLSAMETERNHMMLSSAQSIFSDLSTIASQFAGEQSGIYRAMFAASKAFAVVDAVVKIQQGIANAAATPWPGNIAAMASVASATAGIITTIKGANYSGAYDKGGQIPSGSFGIVGEYGPEIVQGPATVRSRKDTADAFRNAQNESPAPQQVTNTFQVVNMSDPAIIDAYFNGKAGSDAVIKHIKDNPEVIKALSSH